MNGAFEATFEIEAESEDDVIAWAARRGDEIWFGRWGVEFEGCEIKPVTESAVAG